MSNSKSIVCLAMSRKWQGKCVAGKEVVRGNPGPWCRPVSSRQHEEILLSDMRCSNNSIPRLLDILEIPVQCHKPIGCQIENYLIDTRYYWDRVGRLNWDDLPIYIDNPSILWENGSSSWASLNNRIPTDTANTFESSLVFLYFDQILLKVFAPGESFDNPKRRVQAQFEYRNVPYHLWVTDPIAERIMLKKEDGTYKLTHCYLTISLGEPHKGYNYKLVAAVIPYTRVKGK